MSAPPDGLLWVISLCGVLVTALLRLPGFGLAWTVDGALPIVLGALALWHYLDDYGGQLIFSPERSEIVSAMILSGGTFCSARCCVDTVSGRGCGHRDRSMGFCCRSWRLSSSACQSCLRSASINPSPPALTSPKDNSPQAASQIGGMRHDERRASMTRRNRQ